MLEREEQAATAQLILSREGGLVGTESQRQGRGRSPACCRSRRTGAGGGGVPSLPCRACRGRWTETCSSSAPCSMVDATLEGTGGNHAGLLKRGSDFCWALRKWLKFQAKGIDDQGRLGKLVALTRSATSLGRTPGGWARDHQRSLLER